MRRNFFGEAYCSDGEEVVDEMDARNVSPRDCVADIQFNPDEDDWIAEIRSGDDGETVCHVEGFDSRNALREMLITEVGMAARDVNYI